MGHQAAMPFVSPPFANDQKTLRLILCLSWVRQTVLARNRVECLIIPYHMESEAGGLLQV